MQSHNKWIQHGHICIFIFFRNIKIVVSSRSEHVSFRNRIERDDNPKCTVLLKLDFKNAFNSLNRETMLNHVFSNRPELYNYTHCAYGKPSYLFYGSSVIMSEDGTQQGDPEAPPPFCGNNSYTSQTVGVEN